MPSHLSSDPALFGTVGQSLSDAAGLLLGDPLVELLPSLHEGMGDLRLAVDMNANGIRTYETGLEARLKRLWQKRLEQQQSLRSNDLITGNNPMASTTPSPTVTSAPSSTSIGTITVPHFDATANDGTESSGDLGIPEPIRLEAEGMTRSPSYHIQSKPFASAGAMVQIKRGQQGTLESTFSGMSGTYAVIVGYHDEADGDGAMTLELGTETLSWTLDDNQISARKKTSEKTFVRRVVSHGVELTEGDVVRLKGQRDRGELAAVDYIELIPIDPSIPLPFRVEAEDMQVVNAFKSQVNRTASGGGLLELKRRAEGSAQFEFPKASGQYDVVVGYVDREGGESQLSFSTQNHTYDWTADANRQAGFSRSQDLIRRTVAEGLNIDQGDLITLTGKRDGSEYVQFDYVEFIPSRPTGFKFGQSIYRINEDGSTTTTVNVHRTDGTDSESVVSLVSSDGTAIAGSDYVAVDQLLTFAAGEIEKAVELTIIDDEELEANETFSLRLEEVTDGEQPVVYGTSAITIVSDDQNQGISLGRVAVQASVNGTDLKSITSPIEVGTAIAFRPTLPENNSIQTAELLVNGTVVQSSHQAPFSLQTEVPKTVVAPETMTVQVRFTDANGGEVMSEAIAIAVTPDATPPHRVKTKVPKTQNDEKAIEFEFSEAVLFSALDTHTVRILDEKGYPVSQPAFSQEKEGKILKASFEILTPGFYTLELDATKIQDQWGNPLGTEKIVETFEITSDNRLIVTDLSDPTVTAETLAQTIIGDGITIENVEWEGQEISFGTFDNGNAVGLDIESGVILSTGAALDAVTGNTHEGNDRVAYHQKIEHATDRWRQNSGAENIPAVMKQYIADMGEYNLAEDKWGRNEEEVLPISSQLTFDFIPTDDTIEFQFVFASDEYPEFPVTDGSKPDFLHLNIHKYGANDKRPSYDQGLAIDLESNVVRFFGPSERVWGGNSYYNTHSGIYYSPQNSFNVENVNAVTMPDQFNVNHGAAKNVGLEFDGFTDAFIVTANVIPDEKYSLTLEISESDVHFDSAVFITAGSPGCNYSDTMTDEQVLNTVWCDTRQLAASRGNHDLAAELDQYEALIESVGAVVNEQKLHAVFEPLLDNLFGDILTIASAADLDQAVHELYTAITKDGQSLKETLFPLEVLTAAALNSTTQSLIEDTEFTQSLIDLATTYAALNPSTNDDADSDFFLNTLWKDEGTEERSSWEMAADKLQEFLVNSSTDSTSGVRGDDAIALTQFATRLLDVVSESTTLGTKKHDPDFLGGLLEAGKKYSVLLGDPDQHGVNNSTDFFMDILWSSSDASALNQAIEEFDELINVFATGTGAIQFVNNVLQTAEKVTIISSQPEAIRELMGLSDLYAKLRNKTSSKENRIDFFLEILFTINSSDRLIDKATSNLQQLLSLLAPEVSKADFLKMSRKQFQVIQEISAFEQYISKPLFLSSLVIMAGHYMVKKIANPLQSQGFYSDLWNSDNLEHIRDGLMNKISSKPFKIDSHDDILRMLIRFESDIRTQDDNGYATVEPLGNNVENPPIHPVNLPFTPLTYGIEDIWTNKDFEVVRNDISSNPPSFSDVEVVHSRKALIVDPFHERFSVQGNEANDVKRILESIGFAVDHRKEGQIDIRRDFVELEDYGVIAFITHGEDLLGRDIAPLDYPAMYTGVSIDALSILENFDLLIEGNLQFGWKINNFLISPEFVKNTMKLSKNTFVYAAGCALMYETYAKTQGGILYRNYALGEAFIERGASAVASYTEHVYNEFAALHGEAMFNALAKGWTTEYVPGLNNRQYIVGGHSLDYSLVNENGFAVDANGEIIRSWEQYHSDRVRNPKTNYREDFIGAAFRIIGSNKLTLRPQ